MSLKISVIVPVYNVENRLGKCLDSIIYQTYQNIEIILVNDGSTDSSGQICDDYAMTDKRIKVYHKHNEGVSKTRNYGITKATGELICFVDSDDTISFNYLEDFETNVDADIYMQGYIKRKDDKNFVQYSFGNCFKNDFFSVLSYSELNYIINSPCFKLYRRSIIQDNHINFDHKTSYGEDHIFSLQYIIHCNSIHFTKKTGYIYWVSETESLTQRVVPYKEITYYALEAKKIHDILCARQGGQAFKSAVAMTMMTNYIRTLRYLSMSDYNFKDYKWIRDNYKLPIKSINTKSFPIRYKVVKILTCSIFYPLLYPMIKSFR